MILRHANRGVFDIVFYFVGDLTFDVDSRSFFSVFVDEGDLLFAEYHNIVPAHVVLKVVCADAEF